MAVLRSRSRDESSEHAVVFRRIKALEPSSRVNRHFTEDWFPDVVRVYPQKRLSFGNRFRQLDDAFEARRLEKLSTIPWVVKAALDQRERSIDECPRVIG